MTDAARIHSSSGSLILDNTARVRVALGIDKPRCETCRYYDEDQVIGSWCRQSTWVEMIRVNPAIDSVPNHPCAAKDGSNNHPRSAWEPKDG